MAILGLPSLNVDPVPADREPSFQGGWPSALIRAGNLSNAADGDLVEVLTRLADSGQARTRALTAALDLVDPDLIIRRGGRSGAPPGFGEVQTAVSADGGRIPFIDVWYAGRAVVLADARTRLRQDGSLCQHDPVQTT